MLKSVLTHTTWKHSKNLFFFKHKFSKISILEEPYTRLSHRANYTN